MMQVTSSTMTSGGTRWRRFGILFIPGFGVLAGMVFLLATGALAISLSISGIPFVLNATTLEGTGFVQYGVPDAVTNANTGLLLPAPASGTSTMTPAPGHTYAADTITHLAGGTITGLNQTVCVSLASVGLPGSMQVQTGASTVGFTNLNANAPDLVATTADFDQGINIGQDLGFALSGGNALADNGLFSQQAPHVVISGVHQLGIGTTAGTFTIHDLNLQAAFVNTCPTNPTPTFP
jgi:hypothetical protein